MGNRRVVIVDYNHMAYKLAYANASPLLHYAMDPLTGEKKPILTNVQSGSMKSLFKFARGGYDALAVCFDRPCPQRKIYFREAFSNEEIGNKPYKGNRTNPNDQLFDAMEMTRELLVQAGVSCYWGNGYEADDLIYAVIQSAKEEYPDRKIDVVTGDADLIPLVDDQVSVFMRSRKTTFAEHKAIEKTKYNQITPNNYQEIVEDLSSFKNFDVPYNSLLMVKILRGDSSDNISGVPGRLYTPTKLRDLISSLQSIPELDLGNVFRYGQNQKQVTFVLAPYMLGGNTLERLWGMALAAGESDFEMFFTPLGKVKDEVLQNETLRRDMEADNHKDGFGGLMNLSHARRNYLGMDLNAPYGVGANIEGDVRSRKSARAGAPGHFNDLDFAKSALSLSININTNYAFDYTL